jgi:hypothetical protein
MGLASLRQTEALVMQKQLLFVQPRGPMLEKNIFIASYIIKENQTDWGHK